MALPRFTRGALAAALFATAAPAFADEPLFGFVYTTDLLPQGEKEAEQWVTWRREKAGGSFNLWIGRTELSYGVADDFQLSLYANYATTNAYRNGVDGTTVPPETFAERQPDPDSPLRASKYIGTSIEGIYRILSPYRHVVGLALYVEPTIGTGFRELETRLILQKNFLDDLLVTALNVTWAPEARYLPGDPDAAPGSKESRARWDHETDFNVSLGASYRVAANWSIGIEAVHEREYAGFSLSSADRTNSAWYLGPNVHYGAKDWFVTLTFLEQLPFARDYANPPPGYIVGGRTFADDFEKYRLRLKAGFYF